MRRKIQFKQSEIQRAVKGARSAGIDIARVEIEPGTGKIILVAFDGIPLPQNELDKWIEDDARKA